MSEQGDMQNDAELTLRAERDDARLLLETWQSNYKELSAKNGNEISALKQQLAEAQRETRAMQLNYASELEKREIAEKERDAALDKVEELELRSEVLAMCANSAQKEFQDESTVRMQLAHDAVELARKLKAAEKSLESAQARVKELEQAVKDLNPFKITGQDLKNKFVLEEQLEAANAEIARKDEALEPVRTIWAEVQSQTDDEDFSRGAPLSKTEVRKMQAALSPNPNWLKDRLDEARAQEREICASIAGGHSGPGNTVKNAAGYTAACNDIASALRASTGTGAA